ncbi:U3 small nucleolar RNA-associated protein 6 homolog isoform X1 [Nilaparvata lugens]|uniref:U3 small nucleolar RNA-associated protein 6 homolog isoform X1 n=1 Tax=Nilaparvata lugens TaxID=108931 RepID=UPI00193CCEEA|nr:U3 small nucleolar RNA-associated protein 6 homolog isoform X1 [Nilaparvata lugens]
MAESVALRIEDSLDELELLEKSELCTRTEIRVLKIKREQFEFKMARHKKSKEDILKYIDYLMHTIMLMRARKMQKELSLKKCPIQKLIAKRVKMLFDDAIKRYPADLKIWISYIKICEQIRFFSTGSQVVQKMLTVHGDKPSVFKMAADWERLTRKNVDKARIHLQSGLHIHSDSPMLYLELFRLELAYIDQKVNKQQDNRTGPDPDDPIYQLLDVVYDSAITNINSLQFMLELLECTVPYEFTVNIQNKIVSDMQTKFPNEEATWDTVAKMALRAYPKEKSTAKERYR